MLTSVLTVIILIISVSIYAANTVDQIVTSYGNTCILSNHNVTCWGLGDHGVLGTGNTESIWEPPLSNPIDLGDNFMPSSLCCGYYHCCSVSTVQTLKCWGHNEYSQLGLGDTNNRGDQVGEMGDNLSTVDLGTNFVIDHVTCGGYHTCALSESNEIKCWGTGLSGQLGYGKRNYVGDEIGEMGDDLQVVDLGSIFIPIQVEGALFSTCAVSTIFQVKCWGFNMYGTLGLGDTLDRGSIAGQMGDDLEFVDLGTGFNVSSIHCGGFHVCATSVQREIKCFGDGASGELGLGNNETRGDESGEMGNTLPTVNIGTDLLPLTISTSASHNVIVTTNGSVKSWGSGGPLNSLGYGDTKNRGDRPQQMGDWLPFIDFGTGLTVTRISSGCCSCHTCVLLENDTGFMGMKCFGLNAFGQLGIGTNHSFNQTIGDAPNEMGDYLMFLNLGFGTLNPTRSPTISTADPTTFPTSGPSLDPTLEPSSIPTMDPTSDPTKFPTLETISTMDPTQVVTYGPTLDPTTFPTSDPFGNPTYDPTSDSTLEPSTIPTMDPTFLPTQTPSITKSENPTFEPSPVTTFLNSDFKSPSPTTTTEWTEPTQLTFTSSLNLNLTQTPTIYDSKSTLEPSPDHTSEPITSTSLYMLYGGIGAGFMTFNAIAFVDAKCLRKNDYFHGDAIIKAMFGVLDVASDIMFSLTVTDKYYEDPTVSLVFPASCWLTVALPVLLSLLQLANQSRGAWLREDITRQWMIKFSFIMYILPFICGSAFVAVSILNSNAFQMDLFSMGLPNTLVHNFSLKRVWSIIIFENIPQLAFQIWFLSKFGANDVAIVATAFSVISIIVTLLAIKTKANLYHNEQRVLIQFTILGLSNKDRKLQTQTNGISRGIADLLGIHHNLVYIEQPLGFRFKVNLYVNNTRCHGVDYKSLLKDAMQNGSFVEIFRNHWNLKKMPMIKDFKYEVLLSDEQKRNMVHIKMPASPHPGIQFVASASSASGVELVFMGDHEEKEGDDTCFGGMQGSTRGRGVTQSSEEGVQTRTEGDTE